MRRGSAFDPTPNVEAVTMWYLIRYHSPMEAAGMLRTARRRAGLTLRALALRSRTSHTALAAYETGAKVPRVDTLARILRAAGFELDLERAAPRDGGDPTTRGRELVEVLDLAAQFPARHERTLPYPRFGRVA
jgi:transcriptional regulator with XRE-family HTH domain